MREDREKEKNGDEVPVPGRVGVLALLLGLSTCTNNNSSSSSSGTGALFVATQGDSSVSAFSIDLSTGLLTANGCRGTHRQRGFGDALGTSGSHFSVALHPANSPLHLPARNISAYTVNTDGTLAAASGDSQSTGMTPLDDGHGHRRTLPFRGQSRFAIDPASGTISVFAVQGTTLTEVPGSPFPVAAPGAPTGHRSRRHCRHP